MIRRIARLLSKSNGEHTVKPKTAQNKSPGRPKEIKPDSIVERATEVFWRDGPHSLSLNEVCRRIATSKPSIYREFGGEDGLMAAALEHYRELMIVPLMHMLQMERPFIELLDEFVVNLTVPRALPPGCLFTEMRMTRQHLGEQSLARLEAIENERLSALVQWYAKAVEREEVNSALTPLEAAHFIDSQFTLLLMHMGNDRDANLVRQEARLAFSILAPQ
ncbi:MAG: TetR/AcrR family transcriptional regulator [Bradymonadia bacterium]